jgi:hypothetical protein
MDYSTILISSSLISAMVSSIINGWFSIKLKNIDYENAYYKMVLERRVKAYEVIEWFILHIKLQLWMKLINPTIGSLQKN